jgi:hypothetical protein
MEKNEFKFIRLSKGDTCYQIVGERHKPDCCSGAWLILSYVFWIGIFMNCQKMVMRSSI